MLMSILCLYHVHKTTSHQPWHQFHQWNLSLLHLPPVIPNLLPQHPQNPCGSCGITTTSTTFTTFGGICHITAIDVSPPASALRQVSQPTHGRELDFCFCCATLPGSRTHRNLAPQPPGKVGLRFEKYLSHAFLFHPCLTEKYWLNILHLTRTDSFCWEKFNKISPCDWCFWVSPEPIHTEPTRPLKVFGQLMGIKRIVARLGEDQSNNSITNSLKNTAKKKKLAHLLAGRVFTVLTPNWDDSYYLQWIFKLRTGKRGPNHIFFVSIIHKDHWWIVSSKSSVPVFGFFCRFPSIYRSLVFGKHPPKQKPDVRSKTWLRAFTR